MAKKLVKPLKKLKFLHILLIIIAIILFWGLFKKEVKVTSNRILFYMPKIDEEHISYQYDCKKEIANPDREKEIENKIHECMMKPDYSGEGSQWMSCRIQAIYEETSIPKKISVDSKCDSYYSVAWLAVFNKHVVKLEYIYIGIFILLVLLFIVILPLFIIRFISKRYKIKRHRIR